MNLGTACKITRVSNAVAAGTTDVTSSAIDMANFEGCLFIAGVGTITSGAITSMKAQQSSDDAAADAYADLASTGITIADTDDNKVIGIDVYNPQERYLKCVIDRGTQNCVVDFIIAVQYGARVQPTTHDATTVVGVEVHASPAEGTA